MTILGKTYRIRVSNVGISTSLNFRIQGHNLLLAESEGSYTVQQNYTSLDIHVGQSYSFLVTMDQNASTDYYIVASARVVNETIWRRVTGVGILHYTNSKGKAKGHLPPGPQDEFDKTFSMNQARSIRLVIRKIKNLSSCSLANLYPFPFRKLKSHVVVAAGGMYQQVVRVQTRKARLNMVRSM